MLLKLSSLPAMSSAGTAFTMAAPTQYITRASVFMPRVTTGIRKAKVRWLKSCVRIRAEFDFSNLAFW